MITSDLSARLTELRKLRDGWLDGEGRALNGELLDRVERALAALPEGVPVPHVYPTVDGGVSVEWNAGETDVSVEVSPDLRARYHRVNLRTGEEEEMRLRRSHRSPERAERFDLNDTDGWREVFERVAVLVGRS